jgi:alcohol dehydrogenase-like protein
MKVMRFHEYGSPDVLRYQDVELPVPGAGQVRIRVAATSFNGVDGNIRGGFMRGPIPVELPHTPGIDVSGTVDALGESVDGLAIGDQVVGFLNDGQVSLDGVLGVMKDRPGLQIMLGDSEAFLDLEEAMVGADDEVRGDRASRRRLFRPWRPAHRSRAGCGGPIGAVLVVDHLVAAFVLGPAGQGWVKTCPSLTSSPWCVSRQVFTT